MAAKGKAKAGNKSLNRAIKAKEDEFYTQFSYIQNELCYYINHFAGKTIFCNCDDPYESEFFKYFALNFNNFKLKKLIAASYRPSPIAQTELELFAPPPPEELAEKGRPAYMAEINEVKDFNGDGKADLFDVQYILTHDRNSCRELEGNGDFRSAECVELLKQADIVVTNPPFSLFREYVAQLFAYDKKFIIIGNMNAITYKEIFPLIKDDKMWLGYHFGDMAFTVPDYYEPRETRYWEENGVKYRSLGNICWYTNLDIKKLHMPYYMYEEYTPQKYPKYDNFDAINVDKIDKIPDDYFGAMGVPITFLAKYCPEQFEILGNLGSYAPDGYSLSDAVFINGKKVFKRILIRRRQA